MIRNKYSTMCGWMWLLAAVFMTLSYFSKVDHVKLFAIFINLTLAEIWLQPIKKILVKIHEFIFFVKENGWRRERYYDFREQVKARRIADFEVSAKKVIK